MKSYAYFEIAVPKSLGKGWKRTGLFNSSERRRIKIAVTGTFFEIYSGNRSVLQDLGMYDDFDTLRRQYPLGKSPQSPYP